MKHWELHRVLFHLYKEYSIKCFFIWTGGVGLFFSPLFSTECVFLASGPIFPPCFLLPVFTPHREPQCPHTLLSHRLMEIPHIALGNGHYQGEIQWLHWVMHW